MDEDNRALLQNFPGRDMRLPDVPLTAVAVAQRTCRESNVISWTKFVVMSDQKPVEQNDISFNFHIIKLWYMISVRAPALPHELDARRCSLRVPG